MRLLIQRKIDVGNIEWMKFKRDKNSNNFKVNMKCWNLKSVVNLTH